MTGDVPIPIPIPLSLAQRRRHRGRPDVHAHGAGRPAGGSPSLAPRATFRTFADAQAWVDHIHPEAPHVRADYRSAGGGWQPAMVATRTEGIWALCR